MPVLIVEDQPQDVARASQALQAAGLADVEVCNSADLALLRLRQVLEDGRKAPSVILLDLGLPSGSGQEILRYCHSHSELKSIPVVVWTVYNDNTTRQICEMLGARGYVVKGASDKALTEAVTAARS
jgi:CheY-like chemotaxis protein